MIEKAPARDATEAARRGLERKVARAAFVGSVIEWYDFLAYAFLATTIARQFFPAGNDAAALLSTLLVFGSGYAVRPLGAIFFGWYGDRRGRRGALLLTVILMGCATVLIGILPTYAAIGALAPALLTLLRLVQGFGAAGEVVGASTYIAESAAPKRAGLVLSMAPLGAGAGVALAPFVVGLVSALVPAGAMTTWGWRLPFLLTLPLLAISLWLRVGLEDSPEFRRIVARDEVVRFPLGSVLSRHKAALGKILLIALAVHTCGALTTTYMNIHLTTDIGLSHTTVYWLSAVVLSLALPGYLLGGRAIDRFGLRRALVGGLTACCVVVVPVLALMGTTHNAFVIGLLYLLYALASNATLAPAYATMVRAFPGPVRTTGASLGSNIAAVFGAGFGPYFFQLVTTSTGLSVAPAFIIVGVVLVGLLVVPAMRNDQFAPAMEGRTVAWGPE